MTTALDKPLKRAIVVGGEDYVVTLLPEGLRVVRKGHRKGVEVSWQDILSGGVVLDAQLAGSLTPSE